MTETSSELPARSTPATAAVLPPWMNIIQCAGDEEIAAIDQMEARAQPISPEARAIRNLITRFEICHFKIERHLERIIDAIGCMHPGIGPDVIGRPHPRHGEHAWLSDRTGRSRIGQEYLWILQAWLDGTRYEANDPRGINRDRFDAVHAALGEPEAQKSALVTALIGRLALREGRAALPPQLAGFQEQIERMDICHYAFPQHLDRMIEAIGELRPLPSAAFEGCGSCGETQHHVASTWFRVLTPWLQGRPCTLNSRLGSRTPVKEWLVASLAKTLKEQAGLADALSLGQRDGQTTTPPPVTSPSLEPTFVQRNGFHVLGIVTRITVGSESGESFTAIWREFEARRAEVEPYSTDRKYYGVSFPIPEANTFDYFAGMAVEPVAVATVPAGFEMRGIPAASYAVFACSVSTIGPTYRHIFSDWRARSCHVIDTAAPGFEAYPTADDTVSPVLIHVPITVSGQANAEQGGPAPGPVRKQQT